MMNTEVGSRSVVIAPGPFNGVKVFSATMHAQREAIGEVITAWIAAHSQFELREMIVSQSSDASFHCFSLTVLYWEAPTPAKKADRHSNRTSEQP